MTAREVRVYLSTLGRNAFPPGGYRLRWLDIEVFVVRSPGPAAAPALPPPAADHASAGGARRSCAPSSPTCARRR